MNGPRPVVAITGASGGVGRATARHFAERGFDVAVLARGEAGLAGAAAEVERAGGRALALVADVARWEDVDSAADRIEAELGPLEVWVNNAMVTVFARIGEVDPEEFRRATEVTYLGQVHGTMAALRRMRRRDRGRIISVGSSLAFVGIPLQSAYCGAKFACRGFVQSVQAELLDEGSNVTISMVHLPAVNTPQFDWSTVRTRREPQPVPPIYQPEAAAQAIFEAAGDGRRSKVLGAWNKLVVAGGSLLPSVLSHFTAATAIEGQQTDRPVSPDRPTNLERPADARRDFGAHGRFDDRSGGTLDPSFIRSMPSTVRGFLVAIAGAAASHVEVVRRRHAELERPAGSKR